MSRQGPTYEEQCSPHSWARPKGRRRPVAETAARRLPPGTRRLAAGAPPTLLPSRRGVLSAWKVGVSMLKRRPRAVYVVSDAEEALGQEGEAPSSELDGQMLLEAEPEQGPQSQPAKVPPARGLRAIELQRLTAPVLLAVTTIGVGAIVLSTLDATGAKRDATGARRDATGAKRARAVAQHAESPAVSSGSTERYVRSRGRVALSGKRESHAARPIVRAAATSGDSSRGRIAERRTPPAPSASRKRLPAPLLAPRLPSKPAGEAGSPNMKETKTGCACGAAFEFGFER